MSEMSYPKRQRMMAALAMCGIAAGILMFAGSFSVGTVVIVRRFFVPLWIAGFVLGIAGTMKNHALWGQRRLKDFVRDRPDWVGPALGFLIVLMAAQFVMLTLYGRAGAAEIRNGQYVLDDHGRILQVARDQYMAVAGSDSRVFALMTMFLFFHLFIAFWYPQTQAHEN